MEVRKILFNVLIGESELVIKVESLTCTDNYDIKIMTTVVDLVRQIQNFYRINHQRV